MSRTMPEIRVLCVHGDVLIVWERDDDEGAGKALIEYDLLQRAGFLLYLVDPFGKKGKRIKKWDPSHERVLAVPAPAKPKSQNQARGHRNPPSFARSRAMAGGPRARRASW